LEAIYVVFRVTPYSKNIARSLLKEPKIYFYDNGLVEGDEGAIFENSIANSLLKHVYAKIDYLAEAYELKYLRIKDGREVDVAVVCDNQIESVIEMKCRDKNISSNLIWAKKKYPFKAVQLVKYLAEEYQMDHIEVRRAQAYLSELML
jgi:predicted AAA+ superfamily ATPase